MLASVSFRKFWIVRWHARKVLCKLFITRCCKEIRQPRINFTRQDRPRPTIPVPLARGGNKSSFLTGLSSGPSRGRRSDSWSGGRNRSQVHSPEMDQIYDGLTIPPHFDRQTWVKILPLPRTWSTIIISTSCLLPPPCLFSKAAIRSGSTLYFLCPSW